MKIELQHIGKKFYRDWIFQDISITIEKHHVVVLLGGNGSGKSTLLKILSGYLTPTEGLIAWYVGDTSISPADIHSSLALCAPYQMPFPEFTLRENVAFYSAFKPLIHRISPVDFAQKIGLEHALDKPVSDFSSGMQQRLKLGLAILSDVPLLLLDEPTSHLDKAAQQWYQSLLAENANGRTIIVATNEPEKDMPLSALSIEVANYKPVSR